MKVSPKEYQQAKEAYLDWCDFYRKDPLSDESAKEFIEWVLQTIEEDKE